jgi:hypothetical protein
MRTKVLVCALLCAAAAAAAPAWAAQVKICHVPPGNPDNFHTITVNENAVQAHLGHGDLPGACFEHCDQLCDDGNACTIDACDASERCVVEHPPVNCDDGSLCTTDSCDPAVGCASTPKVCNDGANCTVDTCDPMTGDCAFPPVSCPAGQACNASNGSCESQGPTCPCIRFHLPNFAEILNGDFGLASCTQGSLGIFGSGLVLRTTSASPVSAFVLTGGLFGPTCGVQSVPGGAVQFTGMLPDEVPVCRDLIRQAAAAANLTCP